MRGCTEVRENNVQISFIRREISVDLSIIKAKFVY